MLTGEFERRRGRYGDALGHHLACVSPLHLLTQMPGSVGDRLMSRGIEDLLNRLSIPYSAISVMDVDATTTMGGTLVVPGSGALHPHGNEWLPATIERASTMFDRVEILASSFDTSVPSVASAVARENVFCCARDAVSYHEIAPYGRAVLAPDVSVFDRAFERVAPAIASDGESDTVLLAMRDDGDSLLPAQGFQPEPGRNNDVSAHANDLDDFLSQISNVDMVVTDRLHVAIAATLLGRHVRYVDPFAHKISRALAVAFRHFFDDRVVQVDVPWLRERGFVREVVPA